MRPAGPDPLLLLVTLVSRPGGGPLDVIPPSVPALADFFSVPPAALSVNTALFPMVHAVGQLLTGAAADRYGPRAVLVAWMRASALASLGAAWTSSVQAFSGWRVLRAIGCPGFAVLHAVVQSNYAASHCASLRLLMTMMSGVFLPLSPFAGVVLQIAGGWQTRFYVYTALALATTVIAALTLTAPAKGLARPAQDKGTLQLARFMFGTAGVTLVFSVHVVFIVVSPLVFIERRGLDLWAYAGVMPVYGAFYLAGGLIALRVTRVASPQVQVRAGLALMLASALSLLGPYAWAGLQARGALRAAVVAICGVCRVRPAATCTAMHAGSGRPGAAAGWPGLATFMGAGVLSLAATG